MCNIRGHYQIFNSEKVMCKALFFTKTSSLITLTEIIKCKRTEMTVTSNAFRDTSVRITPGFALRNPPSEPLTQIFLKLLSLKMALLLALTLDKRIIESTAKGHLWPNSGWFTGCVRSAHRLMCPHGESPCMRLVVQMPLCVHLYVYTYGTRLSCP